MAEILCNTTGLLQGNSLKTGTQNVNRAVRSKTAYEPPRATTSHHNLPRATTTQNFTCKKYHERKIESYHKTRAKTVENYKNCKNYITLLNT